MEAKTLALPWPPSLNQLRTVLNGRIVSSRAARDYKNSVYYLTHSKRYTIIRRPLRVRIHAFPPDRRKRDVDNLRKILFDSLTYAKIIEDDSLIYEDPLILHRHCLVKEGCLIVELEPLELEPQTLIKLPDFRAALDYLRTEYGTQKSTQLTAQTN